jgi:hypothetical protein
MISQLRKHLSEEDYRSTMEAAARSFKNTTKSSAKLAVKRSRKVKDDVPKDKGKKKARYISPQVEDEMAGLSDGERDQVL